MSQCLFLSNGLQFYLKDAPTQVFSCEFFEIFTSTIFIEYLRATASVPYKINDAADWN